MFPFLYFLFMPVRWYGFPCINYFQDLSTSSCIEAADGSCGSDIVLPPEGSTDVFDVSRTPITDFHYQERHQQGKLAKVSAAWGCNTILDHLAVLFSCCFPMLSSWVVFLPLALTSTQQHLDRSVRGHAAARLSRSRRRSGRAQLFQWLLSPERKAYMVDAQGREGNGRAGKSCCIAWRYIWRMVFVGKVQRLD